jgi:beta-lactamase class A
VHPARSPQRLRIDSPRPCDSTVLAAALASLALIAPPGWAPDTAAANVFADTRAGEVSFAVRTEAQLWGRAPDRVVRSASVLKALVLVVALRAARDRPLTAEERALLDPMVRKSDNAATSVLVTRFGVERIERTARLVGMPRFCLRSPWGLSEITAREQTRFFLRIDATMPARHRAYGMGLLQTIVPSQRWGIGEVQPAGWILWFKGGWGSGTGAVDHQVALLQRGQERVAVAVLSTNQLSHRYGKRTLRGMFARLLVGLG